MDVVWPVDVLVVPEKSITMLRYHNNFAVEHIPLQSRASNSRTKLSFSASRLDRMRRPVAVESNQPDLRSPSDSIGTSRRFSSTLSEVPWRSSSTRSLLEIPGARSDPLSYESTSPNLVFAAPSSTTSVGLPSHTDSLAVTAMNLLGDIAADGLIAKSRSSLFFVASRYTRAARAVFGVFRPLGFPCLPP